MMDDHNNGEYESQRQYTQSLGDQVNSIEQEARMVLPGIQTLFGFQLMVGLNPSFKTLSSMDQYIHLLSLLFVGVSGILVVAPAAYHRQANHQISKHFVEISGRFLSLALAPLAIGTCLDVYLVTLIMGESRWMAGGVTFIFFVLYLGLWFVYPQIRGRRILKLPSHKLPPDR